MIFLDLMRESANFALNKEGGTNMIKRILEQTVKEKLWKDKAILLMGARQVGKTTLLKQLFGKDDRVLWLNGDEQDTQTLFENISAMRLKYIFGQKKIIIIDEAQRIADIGLRLKLITDQIPDIQLIATGSSSFDLSNKVNEPLTGRKWEYTMYPLSFEEMVNHHGLLDEKRLLPHRLVYGYYPDVVSNPGLENEILRQLADSYLYKDVLSWEHIKKGDKVMKLLQALAFQVGSEVSYNELGQLCGLDSKTVERYIILLEQSYIIFRLGSFSRNLRNELKSSRKVYFYDNGIRNAVIANFSLAETRSDMGSLFENFLVAERIKYLQYHRMWHNVWFWRTTAMQEIDLIEEGDGKLSAYEFKWNQKRKAKVPKSFAEHYPEANFSIITPDNMEEFLCQ
jgi:predicted AAA+ superfamily ATPase